MVSKRPNSELKVKINKSSSPRKVSKLDRSPTKRSADHLKKLSGDDDEEDSDDEGEELDDEEQLFLSMKTALEDMKMSEKAKEKEKKKKKKKAAKEDRDISDDDEVLEGTGGSDGEAPEPEPASGSYPDHWRGGRLPGPSHSLWSSCCWFIRCVPVAAAAGLCASPQFGPARGFARQPHRKLQHCATALLLSSTG